MQSQRLTFVLALWPTHWNPVLCFSRLLSADWFRHLFWQEHFRQGLLDHRERGSARAFLSSQGAIYGMCLDAQVPSAAGGGRFALEAELSDQGITWLVQ